MADSRHSTPMAVASRSVCAAKSELFENGFVALIDSTETKSDGEKISDFVAN